MDRQLDYYIRAASTEMKFLVLVSSLVAATSGQVYYNPYVYNHVVGLKSAPCVNAANQPVPCAGYYGKRDAEADPAYVYAGVPFGYPHVYNHVGLKSAPCVNAANQPVPCAAGYYGKRDAEADPALIYNFAAPHAVAATYGGLVHSSHVGVCVNYVGAQVPC